MYKVKAQTARLVVLGCSPGRCLYILTGSSMFYRQNEHHYLLNLIDTPVGGIFLSSLPSFDLTTKGHVDFSWEVSRSMAACQGALLLIDASQGVQAQSLSVFHAARERGLKIIPVLNKVIFLRNDFEFL
jgi:translation factor GUF1, mitochondrial